VEDTWCTVAGFPFYKRGEVGKPACIEEGANSCFVSGTVDAWCYSGWPFLSGILCLAANE